MISGCMFAWDVCSGCCLTCHTHSVTTYALFSMCECGVGGGDNSVCVNAVQGTCSVCVSEQHFVEAAACAGQCTAVHIHKGGWGPQHFHESKAGRGLHALMSCGHWTVCVGHPATVTVVLGCCGSSCTSCQKALWC